jgi:hypothetical protein
MARRIQRLFRGNRGKPPCTCEKASPPTWPNCYHLPVRW